MRDGAILALGPDAEITARFTASETIDADGAPVHPGLVEAHLHCSYQLFRGALPDQLREEDAFREFEGHFYRNVDDEDEHLSTVLASLELLRHGATAFLEPGTVLEVDAAVRGAELTGIRAVLADSFIWDDPSGLAMGKNSNPERNTSMIPRAASDRASVRAKLGRILERDPGDLVTGHVAVLGLGTASTELMLEAKRVANDAGVVLNFHQSYSPGDTARDHERLGAHPLVALRDLGIVDARTTMAHVNHITDEEFAVLVETGAAVAWAPAASMMAGHGSTIEGPACRAAPRRRHGRARIGLAELVERARHVPAGDARSPHRTRGAPRSRVPRRGGRAVDGDPGRCARPRARADRIGQLAPGYRADLVVHTLGRTELLPLTDPVRNLIYSAGSSTVDTVIVDGRVVVRHGAVPAPRRRRAAGSCPGAVGGAARSDGVPRGPEPDGALMEVVIPLDQASFREAPVVLLEAGPIVVTAHRFASGIAALRIQNAVGHLVVLPFRGQQIWTRASTAAASPCNSARMSRSTPRTTSPATARTSSTAAAARWATPALRMSIPCTVSCLRHASTGPGSP